MGLAFCLMVSQHMPAGLVDIIEVMEHMSVVITEARLRIQVTKVTPLLILIHLTRVIPHHTEALILIRHTGAPIQLEAIRHTAAG